MIFVEATILTSLKYFDGGFFSFFLKYHSEYTMSYLEAFRL